MTVERNRRKTKVGIVVSDKMDKTVVVAIEAVSYTHLQTPRREISLSKNA